jgi:hypothetical protein
MRNKPATSLPDAALKALNVKRRLSGIRGIEMVSTTGIFMVLALFTGVKDIFDFNSIWHAGEGGYAPFLIYCAGVGLLSTILQIGFAVDSTEDMANVVTRKRFFTNPYGLPSNIYLTILFTLSLLSTVTAVATSINVYGPVWELSDYVWQAIVASGHIVSSFIGTCKLHTVWEVDNTINRAQQVLKPHYGEAGALA